MNRLNLKDWSLLDDIRQKIKTESEAKNWRAVPDLIIQSIVLCGGEVNDSWMDVAEMFREAETINQPRVHFPIFSAKEEDHKTVPWEYEGRTWYFWLNLFASHYGWSAQEIAELDLDDAIGCYEEISVDEQHRKEWEYGLSEMAYVYDKATKTSRFRPLSKPDWMTSTSQTRKPVKKTMIPVAAMPVGNIINLDEK